MLAYNYNFEYNDEGDKVKAFIFSASDNPCAVIDFNNAMDEGVITQPIHDALTANTYTSNEMPKVEYWLPLE
jgi:hypothetical protein